MSLTWNSYGWVGTALALGWMLGGCAYQSQPLPVTASSTADATYQHLVVTTTPKTVEMGRPFVIVVTAEGSDGTTIANALAPVSVGLLKPDLTLQGNTTEIPVRGVAAFRALLVAPQRPPLPSGFFIKATAPRFSGATTALIELHSAAGTLSK